MPAIAALYAGLIGVLLLFLAALVSRLRRARRVSLGDGGDRDLARAIRVHGNAVEWAVPGMVLLLVPEAQPGQPAAPAPVRVALVVGRVLHAIGLTRTAGVFVFGRFVGSAASWTALLVLSLWSLWAFARTLLA